MRGAQRLSGTVGAGTAKLSGKTISGSVTLLRRSPDEEPWDLVIEDQVPGDTASDSTASDNAATDNTATGNTTPEDEIPDDNSENSEDAR
jgi:hypothetical protein